MIFEFFFPNWPWPAKISCREYAFASRSAKISCRENTLVYSTPRIFTETPGNALQLALHHKVHNCNLILHCIRVLRIPVVPKIRYYIFSPFVIQIFLPETALTQAVMITVYLKLEYFISSGTRASRCWYTGGEAMRIWWRVRPIIDGFIAWVANASRHDQWVH